MDAFVEELLEYLEKEREALDKIGSGSFSYFSKHIKRLKSLPSSDALHTLCCEYACKLSEVLDRELPSHLHARMLLGKKCFWTEEYILRRG